jgi:hypothetical protein
VQPSLDNFTDNGNYTLECPNGSFLAEWKISKIIPVAKIPNPLEPKNYRPISILPSLSKALELVMHDQIVDCIKSHNLLSPYQSGFHAGHSTVTALLNITDDIYRDLEEGLFVLLDFSKAFNTKTRFQLLSLI